jgi:hypothetical protein
MNWFIDQVRKCASRNYLIVLIGTHCNCSDRKITRGEAEETARGFGIPYFEMSAETGEGVEKGFLILVTEGIRRFPDFFGPPSPRIIGPEKPVKKERKGFFGFFDSKKANPQEQSDSDSELLP